MIAPPPITPAHRVALAGFVLAAGMILVGCGGVVPSAAPMSTSAPQVAMASPAPRVRTPEPEPCAGGRLTVGDLPAINAAWPDGVAAAGERAQTTWQADARPVWLQVGCRPLEPAFRWRVAFYSDTAQAFFYADTGQTEPAEVEPATVVTLPVDRLDFRRLYLSLARAGIADAAELSPTGGVRVYLNAPESPFGPPGIAQDLVYYVAIDESGKPMRDLFVSGADWTIHTYEG